IIMTGYASVEDVVSALKEGAYDYLIKPFRSLEEVMLVVDKAVSLRRVKIENTVLARGLEQRVQERTRELEETMNALKRTQTQLVHQEKMASIGQLAAGVAHEINNPVAFVSTNLRTLKEYMEEIFRLIAKYGEAEQAMENEDHARMRSLCAEIRTLKQKMDLEFILEDSGEIIEESLEGTERVRRIVTDLKHFSHKGEKEMQYADLNAELESTLNMVWNELKYKAAITKEFGDLPHILCFPTELNQVFMNLLINAAQAIPNRGEITIRTFQENGHIRIQIRDTGAGISKENLPRLFDPFFTTKEPGKGTGLGLSIAHSIVVEKHHGTLAVQSEMGKGTTFTITLPVEAE
ncbi:MAG: GHKL domain-containing protein, partial [Candidatus Latescibacteria bacterium]|nr:GHKL domain-containing protein [Candidatus Latescibacterota bacterium]